MKFTFRIHFHTAWDQTLYITGSLSELGEWDFSCALPMEHIGNGNWVAAIERPANIACFEYRYILISENKPILEEWQKNRKAEIRKSVSSYLFFDFWQNKPQELAFYSSAFTKSFFGRLKSKDSSVVDSRKIELQVFAACVGKNQTLALTGNTDKLGNWNTGNVLELNCKEFPLWSIELDVEIFTVPVEFKFLILDTETQEVVRWEQGSNRMLSLPSPDRNQKIIVSGLQFSDSLATWKCAGLAVPVFSLRSQQSFGIGDFGDLKKIIDWAGLTGQKVVQILPVNDTTMSHTWVDSYPYNAISIYALHPLYINLQKMGVLRDQDRQDFFNEKQQELNRLNTLHYEEVDKIKWIFFREIYEQEGRKDLSSYEYVDFFNKNSEWLIPYAAFSYLRELNHTADFRLWGKYSKYDKQAVLKLCDRSSEHYKDIEIFYYLQFHLHKQLCEVRDYAYSNSIVLKGDIPIGISTSSVAAWAEPYYFNMELHAGAPPDDFSVTGQNWGFPTYNWGRMEKDNYSWWKKRFCKLSDYFDAYRIDHILGFFRIWEIPEQSVQGLYAWFNPSLPFSIAEMEAEGFRFNEQRFTTPHINEKFLFELFGELTHEVTDAFLNRSSSHHFSLKEPYNTQSKIRVYFANREDLTSDCIKAGLYAIANEVLFIPDSIDYKKFHPRISAFNCYLYTELNHEERCAFDCLYQNYFYQRHNDFWKEQGYKHLVPLISSTEMLVCGEDLGMIPQSVPEVMLQLQILSLEIERMPKESGIEFADLHRFPYRSVCTTSTHDMSTIREWWKENREKTQRYYSQVLQREGISPHECSGELCLQIIRNHLCSPSMLTIIPLQDWLSIDENLRRSNCEDERINIPANPRHYWKYRMHLNIEDMIRSEELNGTIKKLIETTNR